MKPKTLASFLAECNKGKEYITIEKLLEQKLDFVGKEFCYEVSGINAFGKGWIKNISTKGPSGNKTFVLTYRNGGTKKISFSTEKTYIEKKSETNFSITGPSNELGIGYTLHISK